MTCWISTNGGRRVIAQNWSRRHWENLPAPSARHTTQCKSIGGMHESRGKISRSVAGAAGDGATTIAGDRAGGGLVCKFDPGGADGACFRIGPQPDHGGGNVAAVWVVSGIQSNRGTVADVSQSGCGGEWAAAGDVSGKCVGIGGED